MEKIGVLESVLLNGKNEISTLNSQFYDCINSLINVLDSIDKSYITNSSVNKKISETTQNLLDVRDSYKERTDAFLKILDDSISMYKDSDSFSLDSLKNIDGKPIINNEIGKNSIDFKNHGEKSMVDFFSSNKTIKNQKNEGSFYTIDENGDVSLKVVHPELKDKMEKLVNKCSDYGIDIKITESVRTVSRQNQLYNQGRTTKGEIVTNAKGSDYSSNHQWGIAFDVCINGSSVDEMYDVQKLKKVGEIGKSIGLEWGGDWESFVDMPHFQLPYYGSGPKKLKAMYGNPAIFCEDSWGEKFLGK